jgi:hypothetical protein
MGGGMLKNEVISRSGNDLISWECLQYLLIEIQSILCKEGCCSDRYNGVMHCVFVTKVYIKYPCHARFTEIDGKEI